MITEKERLPLHNRVREHLRAEYLDGSHDVLPSLRELSQRLEINHATISRALRDLESEGVVEIIPRKGIFPVKKNRNGVLAAAGAPGKGIPTAGNATSPDKQAVGACDISMVVLYDQLHEQLDVARPIFAGMQEASTREERSRVTQTAIPVSSMPEASLFLQQARENGTAGLVFLGYGYLPFPESLAESRFIFDVSQNLPVILSGTPHEQLPLDCVYCDARPQMREFLDGCYADGLRHFEFIGSGSSLPHQVERHDEFCDFVMHNGLTWKREYLQGDSVEELSARLRDLPCLPEVVVTANTSRAVAVALEAQRRGLSLPQDLRLLCFASLTQHAEPLLPYASVLLMDEAEVGKRAWQLLHERVENGAPVKAAGSDPLIERVPAKFISRH